MRKLTESFANPGNGLAQGLTNHYTPIDNIVMNVRNIFGALLGLVVSKAEDGVSLKIQSSTFTDPDKTQDILYSSTFDGRTYLAPYIMQCGLQDLKIINIGQSCVAYFCPGDLAGYSNSECTEMKESKILECEMFGQVHENFEEEELEDKTQEELAEIINNKNKVKAASDFEEKLKNVLTLPENLYIKATKDIDGHESIALRYKFEKRRPFNGKADSVISLMNIYSTGANAIWVDAFLNRDIYSQDIINTIETILQFLNAQPTDDECIYNIQDENTSDETDSEEQQVTVEEPEDAAEAQ